MEREENVEEHGNLNLDHKVDIIIRKRLATSLCPPARRFPPTGESSPAEVCITRLFALFRSLFFIFYFF